MANVFETLNARPPGVLASLALLAVHAGSFLVALVMMVVLMLGQGGSLLETASLVARRPVHAYGPGTTQVWHGTDAPAVPSDARVTIIATFGKEAAAKAAFTALPFELPPQATLRWFGESLLLTLPADRDDERTFWSERLRQQAGQVVVDHRQRGGVRVRLFCVAPGQAEAERLEAALREYLHAPNCSLLLPPWSAAWQSLSAVDQQRFQKARQTLARLQNLSLEALRNPDIQAMNQRLNATLRSKDLEAMGQLIQEREEALQAEKQRLLESLRAEGEESVDQALLVLWELLTKLQEKMPREDDDSDPAEKGKAQKSGNPAGGQAPRARRTAGERDRNALRQRLLLQRMAERMGRLPLVGDQPAPGSDLEAVVAGGVWRQGLYLAVEYLSFRHPAEGLPALAEWLGRRGCIELRYGFQPAIDDEEDS